MKPGFNLNPRLITYPTATLAVGAAGGLQAIKSMFIALGGGLPAIIGMILGLCFIVTIHEFGHWIVARSLGFKTPVFSIGFGYRKWSLILGTFWETEFRIAPILLGGYVSLPELGDETATKEDLAKNAANPHKFAAWKLISVAAAGVAFNFASVPVMIFTIFTIYGQPFVEAKGVYVTGLAEKPTIAREAGLEVKDRIISIGGAQINTPIEVTRAISSHIATPTTIVVEREGKELSFNLTPNDEGHVGINIDATYERVFHKFSVAETMERSLDKTGEVFVGTVKGFGLLLGLVEKPANVADADLQVHGLIGIIQTGAGALESGTFNFIWFLAAMSVNLALINILPFPLLDGGHIVYFTIEGLTGKQIPVMVKSFLGHCALGLLLFVIAMGTYNDLIQIKQQFFG